MARDSDISKFMSLVLRHAPQEAGLTLDANGWADFATLSHAVFERFGVGEAEIRRVVAESPKKRFALEGARIRAVQGHSVEVDLALPSTTPPAALYHGTARSVLPQILSEGLKKQARQHVHLSPDIDTAKVVAARRAGPNVILEIAAGEMAREGGTFHLSGNGVWLTDEVPPRFIREAETAT